VILWNFTSNDIQKPDWRANWRIWKSALPVESLSHYSSKHSYEYLHIGSGREAIGISKWMAHACWKGAGGQVAVSGRFVLWWKHQQLCASSFQDNTTPLGLTTMGMSVGYPETCSWSTDKLSQLCVLSAAQGASPFLGCYSVLELFQNKTKPLAPPLLCFGVELKSHFSQLLGNTVWF